jgi:hypothetical protein
MSNKKFATKLKWNEFECIYLPLFDWYIKIDPSLPPLPPPFIVLQP